MVEKISPQAIQKLQQQHNLKSRKVVDIKERA